MLLPAILLLLFLLSIKHNSICVRILSHGRLLVSEKSIESPNANTFLTTKSLWLPTLLKQCTLLQKHLLVCCHARYGTLDTNISVQVL